MKRGLLAEAESIISNQQLTVSSDNNNDLQSLTPNYFLVGHSFQNIQFVNVSEKDINCRDRWKVV